MVTENKNQIGLFTAILININVMLGAGIFINPKPLTQLAGPLGFMGYLLGALVLLPVALCIAELAKDSPTAGGLYVYSKNYIGNNAGFLSGWAYFLGKTTSAALLANTFVTFFYKKFIFLQNFPILFLDACLIFFLIFINILGVSIGGKIQYLFTTMKSIPVIFVLTSGFFFFNPELFHNISSELSGLLSAIPVAIFALTSFEITASIGHLIKNPEKNLKRSILISFSIITSVAVIFQLALYGALGDILKDTTSAVGAMASTCYPTKTFLPDFFNIFVFTSIISGSFGSLTSNCWNLFALAKDRHLPFSNSLIKVSKTNTPWVSLIIEGLIALLLLAITSNQVPLQNMTIFGMVTAYLLSSIAAFNVLKNKYRKKNMLLIPVIAVISSSYIIYLCVKNLFVSGLSFPFLTIFLIGIGFAVYKKNISRVG